MLWFAFKLVSLNHWKQHLSGGVCDASVVICFQISIFEPLETTLTPEEFKANVLWFAFKLVSLNHWKQQDYKDLVIPDVVICFQISIFEPLETTISSAANCIIPLWFAFKLVSLNHWKQHNSEILYNRSVVICFQISIFEPFETTIWLCGITPTMLWFAFKLVSLNHWKQHQ